MFEKQNLELPYKKRPSMWNYLYPFVKDQPEPAETVRRFLSQDHHTPGVKSLYVHIPFCDTICTFCPFIRSTNYQDKLRPYLDALQKELKMVAATSYIQNFELDAVYIGGGTPSVLSAEMIDELCTTIHQNFKLKPDYEWTFEVEAKSATEDKMKAMAANGVNRISFGVQTLNPYYRKIFNLTASMEELQRTRDFGEKYFDAFNMDLLYQLPGQTLELLQEDLEKAVQLGTTSIDTYPLEYLVTSKGFLNLIKDGKIAMPPNAQEKLDMQHHIMNFFAGRDYEQTYIYTYTQNSAAKKRFKFGETIYGRYEDEYIGCGQAAASYLCGLAHNNKYTTQDYITAVESGEHPIARAYEYHAKEKGLIFLPKTMSMSLDYLNGLQLDPFFHDKIAKFENLGLVEKAEGELRLTGEGKKWYLEMMIDLLPDDQAAIYQKYVETMKNDRQFEENTDLITIE